MTLYVMRRLAWLPIHLLIVTFVTFAIARFGPGDPVSVAAGQFRDPAVLARVRAERGLDGTVFEQYWRWVSHAVRGDFGQSFLQEGYTVSELLRAKLAISAQLNLVALVIVFGLGIPLGLLAAWANGTWIDPFVISALLFLTAIPVLVMIPPLLWLFAVPHDWLPNSPWVPVGGWDGLFEVWWIGDVVAVPIPDPHLYLPLLVLTIGGFAGIARLVRIAALEVLTEDYVRTARAKGLQERTVVLRHVLPNSLLPVVTVTGFALTGIFSGSLFAETLLGINGIGRFMFEALQSRDYDVILAMTVIVSTAFVLLNLAAEISYAFIDPRIRLGEESAT